ncbi:protein archease, partial [Candidatus Pacearchaeota archaeon CG_4_10_14_0_2_um_filter_31_10]
MVTRKFEFLEHTADIKFRAYGSDLNEIFENSAYALKEVMVGGKVKGKNKKKFLIINPVSLRIDLKRLLYSFLEKFLI